MAADTVVARRRHRLVAAAVAALGAALSSPLAAAAHALLQSSSPAAGEELSRAPTVVVVRFGETPDPQLSSLAVVDTSGERWDTGPTRRVPGHPDELEVGLRPLPRGVYTVAWRTISAVDGHLASGSFAFGVGVSPQDQPTAAGLGATTPGPTPEAVAGRWLFYAGLVVLVGVAVVAAYVLSDTVALRRWPMTVGEALAAAGLVLLATDASRSTGLGPDALATTSVGHALAQRAAPLVASLLPMAIFIRSRSPRRRRFAAVAVGVLAVVALYADVAASHAGAQRPVAANLAVQLVHVVAAGAWIGGLAVLLASLRQVPGAETALAVRRFSRMAGFALVAVAATGVARAAADIGSWSAVRHTGFGRLVLLKGVLLLGLAILGGLNRFRYLPLAGRRLVGLRRVASGELLLGAAALVTASALVNLPPPVSGPGAPHAAAAAFVQVEGNDGATTVRATLRVSPGTAGFDTFTLRLVDYDSGAPVDADTVRLRFSLPGQTVVGDSSLTLRRIGPGVYSGQGANLSVEGTWKVVVLVERGAASTEVPLSLTTRTTPPRIEVSRFRGEPTLYTIHLPGRRSVQLYLDPGHRGSNQLHLTAFDASGNELPLRSLSLTATEVEGTAVQLITRQLSPGHFVAEVFVAPPRSHVEAVAETTTGGLFRVALDMEVTP